MCYDAGLQEAELEHEITMPPEDGVRVPAQAAPDPQALKEAADILAAAGTPSYCSRFCSSSSSWLGSCSEPSRNPGR